VSFGRNQRTAPEGFRPQITSNEDCETPLRLLHLEDDPVDAELIATTLVEGGDSLPVAIVDTRQAFVAALKNADGSHPGDYSIPALTA